MLNYSSVSVEVLTNTTPATITWQTSSDSSQTNIRSMMMADSSAMVNSPNITTTSAVGIFVGSRAGRYFRISTNLAGGNTATFVITFYTSTISPPAQIVFGGVAPVATTNTSTSPFGAAIMATFDDTSPTAITENQFGSIRMSANRNVYTTLRDAAGNERGANVTSANELVVSDSGLRPAGTSLTTYSVHLTSNGTTTPTSSTAYISTVAISNEVGGTTSTITIQDKQGTPLKLINGVATTALTTAPTVINFQTPVKMVSGIDIIAAGAVAATVDIWINYYQ